MPKAKKDPTAELYKNAMSHALWVENEIDCLRREGAKRELETLAGRLSEQAYRATMP